MVNRCVKDAVNRDSGVHLESLEWSTGGLRTQSGAAFGECGMVKRLAKNAVNLDSGVYSECLG